MTADAHGVAAVEIMAILNVTPDSFSDGGNLETINAVLNAAEIVLKAGADILDIGGESTRPGAACVPVDEELSRVIPAIEAIHQRFPEVVISIDTRKATVAQAAVDVGATIINDVSGLQFDPEIATVTAETGAKLVIMHSQGTPETMQKNPHYPTGVVTEVSAFFERQIAVATEAGVRRGRIILDPGFGFGKTVEHNLTLLRELHHFHRFGLPILAGTSRKSFLAAAADVTLPPEEREALTAVSLALAIQNGASMVRVHDVVTQAPVVRFMETLLSAG